MSFTIISTISPDFQSALDIFVSTWYANSGASEIVIHEINQGSWPANIIRRNEILHAEVISRSIRGEKVLSLDIDTLVLRDLSGGFSDDHAFSVAGWPDVNMGVFFLNTSVRFPWRQWMDATLARVKRDCVVRDPSQPNRRCDTEAWRPRLWSYPAHVCKLGTWEWNYHHKEMHQWQRDLPLLRDITKVLHLKGHGDWPMDKIEFAKRLWPEELSCIK